MRRRLAALSTGSPCRLRATSVVWGLWVQYTIANLDALRPHIQQLLAGAPSVALDRARLQSPVANPGKVIAVRSNYPGASSSTDDGPQLFLKASSSVVGPGAGVELRLPGRRVDHEVELVAVLGRRVDRAGPQAARARPWPVTASAST